MDNNRKLQENNSSAKEKGNCIEKVMIEERHKYYDQMKPLAWPTSYKEFGKNTVVTSSLIVGVNESDKPKKKPK